MKDFILLAIGAAIIVGSFYLFFTKPAPERYQTNNPQPTQLTRQDLASSTQELWVSENVLRIEKAIIQFEVADTPNEISLGLSGRESLEPGNGLLFIMPTSAKHGFWMKDMNFPIDIIWIDDVWVVAGVERSAQPESYPETFTPNRPVKYVLEVPAGTADEFGIDTGGKVYFGY
ncbi:MAG: DUF192 domain-containing protein [Candidatus Zambryskibacteria bacterium]|nr:DUF192 domain-containing protein [Candidatus Zambryskibacteria bacterium]